MAYNNIDDKIEYRFLEEVIINLFLLHELETDFTFTPKCYRGKLQSMSIGHENDDSFYE